MTRPVSINRTPFEHDEQASLVLWMGMRGIRFFAVPNGARVRPGTAKKLQQEGMLSGAPDLVIIDPPPSMPHCHVVVEMKRRKGGTLSPEQKQVHEIMRHGRWHVVVARGAEDGISQLTSLGFVKNWRAGREPAKGEKGNVKQGSVDR